MTCYHPIDAWKDEMTGRLTFTVKATSGPQLQIPCGRCIGCRKVRVRNWQIRCMHESQMHSQKCFVTLTYDQEHYTPGLEYTRDFQPFMKRLRHHKGKIRFFAAGEYGKELNRPHWHALLFGVQFNDLTPIGENLYISKELEKIWGHGYTSVGEINYTTAGYTAKYAIKKINGKQAKKHYERINTETGEIIEVKPEQARMSLKPGIGKPWFDKYWPEIYTARDAVVRPGNKTTPPPRAYDTWLAAINPKLLTEKETERYIRAQIYKADATPERLAAREAVAIATHKHTENLKI